MKYITSSYGFAGESLCFPGEPLCFYDIHHATGSNQYQDAAERVGSKLVKSSMLNPVYFLQHKEIAALQNYAHSPGYLLHRAETNAAQYNSCEIYKLPL